MIILLYWLLSKGAGKMEASKGSRIPVKSFKVTKC